MIVRIVGLFEKIHIKYNICVIALFAMIAVSTMVHGAPVVSVMLSGDGVADMPIVVSTGATDRIKVAATDLATYLGRITGADFTIENGDGKTGIAVGLPGHFPALALQAELAVSGISDRETYILRTHVAGVHIIGTTETAVEDAVWDFLYRLGYRQFFPGKTWEIVPKRPRLKTAVNVREHPDYYARSIWPGYNTWPVNRKRYARWCTRNRVVEGVKLKTGHAYGFIAMRCRATLDAHPEYLGLVNGKRDPNANFCVSNPGLRKMVVDYALATFEKNPELDSVSMDPRDGAKWCECDKCKPLGSPSDRCTLLANDVAEALAKRFGTKLVGFYAYAEHCPPPGIQVHPNVVVSVATAFLRDGYSVDELMDGWAAKGAAIGLRGYFSVNTWDRDLPGDAGASNTKYLRESIPKFHARGARYFSAESGANWGPCGLGYYLATRMFWDVENSVRCDEITADFLTCAFGPAAEPMRHFYEVIDGANTFLVFDDQLGRMYRHLKDAQALADTPQIQARLNDLILYSWYCDLFDEYRHARGKARQAAFERVIRHAYRMRKTMMVHSLALYRDLVHRDEDVSLPQEAQWDVPEDKNPWKSSDPFTDNELTTFLTNGIANHKLVELDFEPVAYSKDLVPATPLGLPAVPLGNIGLARSTRVFYTWVDKGQATIELKITGGFLTHYRDRGNVKVELWKIGEANEMGERETLVARDCSVPPDGKERTVRLPVKAPGLYRIWISDGGDLTRVTWATGMPMTINSTVNQPAIPHARWSACFYVPKGTRVIGLYADPDGELLNNKGQTVFSFEGKKAGYYSFPVPEGQDGSLWRLHFTAGAKYLMTVPPCLARTSKELLLPREVVKADQTK